MCVIAGALLVGGDGPTGVVAPERRVHDGPRPNVDLRGIEPLTFSLRTRRLTPLVPIIFGVFVVSFGLCNPLVILGTGFWAVIPSFLTEPASAAD